KSSLTRHRKAKCLGREDQPSRYHPTFAAISRRRPQRLEERHKKPSASSPCANGHARPYGPRLHLLGSDPFSEQFRSEFDRSQHWHRLAPTAGSLRPGRLSTTLRHHVSSMQKYWL